MIIIDRSRCVSCGACNAMTMMLHCIKSNPEAELYEEPQFREGREYVEKVMHDCWSKCIYLSGVTWSD